MSTAVDVAGGSLLATDHLGVGQILNGSDGGVFLDNDHLHAGGITLGEVHNLQTLFIDGDAGHDDVTFAGLCGHQGGVKIHVIHDQFQSQFIGNGLSNLHVNTLKSTVVGDHLIRRECCVGGVAAGTALVAALCGGLPFVRMIQLIYPCLGYCGMVVFVCAAAHTAAEKRKRCRMRRRKRSWVSGMRRRVALQTDSAVRRPGSGR